MPFQTRAVGGCLSFLSFPSVRAFLSLLLTRGGRVEIPSRPFWWLAVEDVCIVDRTNAIMFLRKGRSG